jgi:hypothetical protein
MIRIRALLLVSCALLGACATKGSYLRWQELSAQPENRVWATCIGRETNLRLASQLDPQPPTPQALDAARKKDPVVVIDILSACRTHMANFGDGILADKRNKRMLMEAYEYYRMQKINIRAAEEASII